MTRFSKIYTGGLLLIKEKEDFPLLCIALGFFVLGLVDLGIDGLGKYVTLKVLT